MCVYGDYWYSRLNHCFLAFTVIVPFSRDKPHPGPRGDDPTGDGRTDTAESHAHISISITNSAFKIYSIPCSDLTQMNKRFILMKEQLQILSDDSFITQLLAKGNVTIDLLIPYC